ncbi:class I SAM-dependent methyltransferase [Synechococcus sp. CS-1332]|uniref:class I SAM-dependent methyltransferase n=1 Tax=Synechococcus sp. CS-1332 TaxID=2847972 RepID=UPI00223A847B|nr:class I SAM-dependent methyltransferase [Synechococcus sp. CS-1332]MCT0207761.1 class I SAM-dependent methyltransferase [Synechococcus sp. CS-1332]
MDSKPAYPIDKTYGAFIHRELSVSWLVLATLMGGRHRLDPGLVSTGFRYLDLGCGHGLNLLFNAAAHPQASFYGLDLNPTHIAEASAKAEALGLSNVHFALADLTTFAAGRPSTGPCCSWPEAYDVVVAHGLASWVGEAVRNALVAAAGNLLRPGGIFYCSYNTYPGWLSRSTLQMLSVEEALRAGGSTSVAGIRKAAQTLTGFTGTEENTLPLGKELPGLRALVEALQPMPEAYLVGEYQSAHQPLYVGPMHRLCAAHGLSHIGSATLPEMFPDMLDDERRTQVMGAVDLSMREVLLDLAINQTFRRDLFAKGPCPPSRPWRRQAMADLSLHLGAASEKDTNEFSTSLGRLGVDADFMGALKGTLADRPVSLGWLLDQASLDLDDLLMRLSVLIGAGVIGVGVPAQAGAEALQRSVAGFNRLGLEQTTAGEEIGALLSPVLLQPIPISVLEAFFLQVAHADLASEDVVQLVWMGISMAGGNVKDKQGQPIEDPEQALSQLQEFWETFARERLPLLRRLGIASAAAA